MIIDTKTFIRPANNLDLKKLASMIHFGSIVHRHLDWRAPLGWVGFKPFDVAESEGNILAALACPPDPPTISWVRLFVCNDTISQNKAWELLWPNTLMQLRQLGVKNLAAIPLQKWFIQILEEHGFKNIQTIVSLVWDAQIYENICNKNVTKIRVMEPKDLQAVREIDNLAFGELWQNSLESIQLAFDQSILATIAYDDEGLTGYQICTPTQYGAHLGRLAVHPRAQRQGVGYGLVNNIQQSFKRLATFKLTVNTQNNNANSLSLYKKAGFVFTHDEYPVFLYSLKP